MLSIVVLKFGSSVLASPNDLPTVVDEIYRHLRAGHRVLAVVSAYAGETDRLFASAQVTLGAEADPYEVASHVARGERESAADLNAALVRAGISARLVGPNEIGLRVEGGALESDLKSVHTDTLHTHWERHTTLVLPGFIGIDQGGRTCLLGRGGSDLSAIFLAGALGAQCHLVKDVPGVFDRDPALNPDAARRYEIIPWHDAAEVAGPLIQPKALGYAERHRIPFSVSRANGSLETRVLDAPKAVWGVNRGKPARLRLALVGLGTVGGGVYERLAADPDRFDIRAVVTRRLGKTLAAGVPLAIATKDFRRALAPDVDLVIELLGGVEPAGSFIEEALERKKYVVTANKAAVAKDWTQFAAHAEEPDRRLWCSAAVGGAVPVLETLVLLRPRIQELRGAVSGTCNYVLDLLGKGATLQGAIRAAQDDGLAEHDPQRDLSGIDTADKLSLMAHAAFGVHAPPHLIPTCGLRVDLKADPNQVWRLVARAARTVDGVALSVAPEQVNRTTFLGQMEGAENRIEIVLDGGEIVRLAGQGAGRWPTSTAVMGDVHEVARRLAHRNAASLQMNPETMDFGVEQRRVGECDLAKADSDGRDRMHQEDRSDS